MKKSVTKDKVEKFPDVEDEFKAGAAKAGASLIKEEKPKMYICTARNFCTQEGRHECMHAIEHTHDEVHGCGNGSWCVYLAAGIAAKNPVGRQIDPLKAPDMADLRAIITEANINRNVPMPDCVEVK